MLETGGWGVGGEELNLGVWLARRSYYTTTLLPFGRINISRTRGAARTRNRYPSSPVWLHVLSIPPVTTGFFKTSNVVSRKKSSIFHQVDNFRACYVGEMMVVITRRLSAACKIGTIFFFAIFPEGEGSGRVLRSHFLFSLDSSEHNVDSWFFFSLLWLWRRRCVCTKTRSNGVSPLPFSVNSSVPFQIRSFLLSPPQEQSKRFGREREFQFPTF